MNSRNEVRVGMVGTSWWADLFHLPLLKGHDSAQVSAICGRNRVRAEEMAAKYQIPNVFTDYHEMIARGGLDAIVIAVPDSAHYPITMAALDAGLHVLGEKPMAMDLGQAREMLAKAESAGVKHMICYTWRWIPYIRLMEKLVREGYTGDLYNAQFEYSSDYATEGNYQWKWDQAHGLGVLGDLGSHSIDWAHLLGGDIVQVQARLRSCVERLHPERHTYLPANDTASLLVGFANGATGTIYLSSVKHAGDGGHFQRIELTGSEGILEMTASWAGYAVRGMRRGETELNVITIPEDFLDGTSSGASPYEQILGIFSHQSIGPRLFIDSILNDCPITPGFADGVKVQAVIEAAIRSDESGCWESPQY